MQQHREKEGQVVERTHAQKHAHKQEAVHGKKTEEGMVEGRQQAINAKASMQAVVCAVCKGKAMKLKTMQ